MNWFAKLRAHFAGSGPATPNKTEKRRTGDRAEDFALALLEKRGHRLVARNVSYTCGEIDLITVHTDTLVFSEVRSRASSKFGSAADTVTPSKQKRIRRAAEVFLNQRYAKSGKLPNCRFDVVWITLVNGEMGDSGVIEGAF